MPRAKQTTRTRKTTRKPRKLKEQKPSYIQLKNKVVFLEERVTVLEAFRRRVQIIWDNIWTFIAFALSIVVFVSGIVISRAAYIKCSLTASAGYCAYGSVVGGGFLTLVIIATVGSLIWLVLNSMRIKKIWNIH